MKNQELMQLHLKNRFKTVCVRDYVLCSLCCYNYGLVC